MLYFWDIFHFLSFYLIYLSYGVYPIRLLRFVSWGSLATKFFVEFPGICSIPLFYGSLFRWIHGLSTKFVEFYDEAEFQRLQVFWWLLQSYVSLIQLRKTSSGVERKGKIIVCLKRFGCTICLNRIESVYLE